MQQPLSFERRNYEDPFLDMASTMLPKNYRKLQELCHIFATTHPQIAPIVWRMAEYSITSIIYSGDKQACDEMKKVVEDECGILDRSIEMGLDYYGYGNAFGTVQFPFLRFYACNGCKTEHRSNDLKNKKFDGKKFSGVCGECKINREMTPQDRYIKRAKGIKLTRLNPMLMDLKYNAVTGETFYYYDIPIKQKKQVLDSDWDIIDSTPVSFLKCIINNRKMRVRRIFHFKRPTLSGSDMQWGLPLIMPVLKDAYLNQIYKKADEQIALEHSVPLRILFPESTTQDPLQKIALGSFQGFLKKNLAYWRKDKNAILTAPMPIGAKVIGGDQSAYQTIQARQFVVDEIISGCMVTKGFVMGGEQWSAGSINQRQLENTFLNYGRRLDSWIKWVVEEIRSYLDMNECSAKMTPFKKVDDIQMTQLVLQMAREKRVSWEEALSRMDIDAAEQLKKVETEGPLYLKLVIEEIMGQASAGAKSAVFQAAAAIEAEGVTAAVTEHEQAVVDKPGQIGKLRMDHQIESSAHELLSMDDDEAKKVIKRMIETNPEYGRAVTARASEIQRGRGSGGDRQSGGQSQSGSEVDELMSSGSPEEVAKKLSVMTPQKRLQALKALGQQNPMLAMKVSRLMAAENMGAAGMAAPGKDTVDMRPNPEKLPPRRENKTV